MTEEIIKRIERIEKILSLVYDKCFPSVEPTEDDIKWANEEIDKYCEES